MLQYSLNELRIRYERYVSYAQKKFVERKYLKCIRGIYAASLLQYSIIDLYSDVRLNRIIKNLSRELFQEENETESSDTIILYDSFSWDNHGLTQQYLDALYYTSKENVVYVYEKGQYTNTNILKFVEEKCMRCICVNGKNEIEKAERIVKIIKDLKPGKAVFQIGPYSIAPFLAFYSYPKVVKYNINLTDHAFGLGGADFFNYTIEFRDYGAQVSLEKRGYKRNQINIIPFYPWIDQTPFNGFPEQAKGKVVIFSGAAYYKIEGGDGVFQEIVKQLVTQNSDAIILFAGYGNKTKFEDYIKQNKLENRVILLGHRTDINEVFKHSDIFLSTFPLFGGLMVQYAAINKIPILAYGTPEVESLVCTKKDYHFVFNNVSLMLAEAKKLITDPEYRKSQGSFFGSLCVNQEDFREAFRMWFLTPANHYTGNVTIDYEAFMDICVRRYNEDGIGAITDLRLLSKCPSVLSVKMICNILACVPYYVKRIKQKLK